MARKNFKSDLGELITGSNIELEVSKNTAQDSQDSKDDKDGKLNFAINQLKEELHLWRTGKLTMELFKKSIKEHGLKYDAEKNEFSKI